MMNLKKFLNEGRGSDPYSTIDEFVKKRNEEKRQTFEQLKREKRFIEIIHRLNRFSKFNEEGDLIVNFNVEKHSENTIEEICKLLVEYKELSSFGHIWKVKQDFIALYKG